MQRKNLKQEQKLAESIQRQEQLLEELNSQLMQQQDPQLSQINIIDYKNQIVLNFLKAINFPQVFGFYNATVDVSDKIVVCASPLYSIQLRFIIEDFIQKVEARLITEELDFSVNEVKYIKENLSKLIEDFQKQNDIQITYQSSSQIPQKIIKSLATSLNFEGKELQIAYADISRIECDAIVNSCNQNFVGDFKMLSGVSKSISEMGGTLFCEFCNDYINLNKCLKTGEAITYQMPAGNHIKFIINVSTPIYSNGKQTTSDLEEIKKNIQAIFSEANKLQVQTLAIPIIGGGACGYSFSEASEVVLREVINILFSNQNQIKTVIITELMDSKINQLQNSLKLLLQPPKQKICQNQWQWKDFSTFKDFDDENINIQIQEIYEEFVKTGQEQRCFLKFPFSKEPGTHLVDVKNQKLHDISLHQEVSFTVSIIANSKQYFINNQKVSDALNEYLIYQMQNNAANFTIFYKNYEVVINKQEMYQINLLTKYKRKIQFCKKQNIDTTQGSKELVLTSKQYDLKDFQYKKFPISKKEDQQIVLESLDKEINNQFKDILRKELDKNITTLQIKVPNMSNEELQDFEEFLLQNTLKFDGNLIQGQTLTIKLFLIESEKLKEKIGKIELANMQYPPQWEYQSENFHKCTLSTQGEEYQKIQSLFNQTDKGKIVAINRIQNKLLWENYISERKKLFSTHNQQGQQLQNIEKERYLWHGVISQHPKIIYEGTKEAFDSTYCNNRMWGPGIYFAEKAIYSRDYSYTLTANDDKGNVGKKVFLCCLVTTGKVEVRQQDHTIQRASQGYDCVSGFINGSDIFILYKMDVRRAYPAYEVIYE